jgi:predicted ATPase
VQFLTRVSIKDFRSIANADLWPFDDLTPLVGVNGSGKSNLLRALNVFFNDVVEGGEALRLRRDFREPGRKAKLRVVIEVDLDYSAFDSLRNEILEALETLSDDSGDITFRKEWTLDPVTLEEVVMASAGKDSESLVPLTTETGPLAARLLNAVRFRYVPNHIHPSQILQSEQNSIRKVLQDQLGRRKVLSDDAVKGIAEVAADMMKPIRLAMEQATGEVADVELATPSDWRDLAWGFGLKMRGPQGQSFETLLHGSGLQSVLAYHVLHAIDTSFSGSFGWRKGAVWALEEPESFLHAGLQGELARAFTDYATGESLQILFSTHSPAFLGAAERGIVVTMDDSGRSRFEVAPKAELLRTAYRVGVAPFAHPLHVGPPMPLLLLEGENDRDLIHRAYAETGVRSPFEILCLADFDPDLTGGEDQIATWLGHNRPALLARPESSPVFALLDWESADKKVYKIAKSLEGHPTSRCLRWPVELTNQDLSPSFVGIEKFLSTQFVEHVAEEVGLSLQVPAKAEDEEWRYDVKRARLKASKHKIHAELRAREDPSDIGPLIDATEWLTQQLGETPTLF